MSNKKEFLNNLSGKTGKMSQVANMVGAGLTFVSLFAATLSEAAKEPVLTKAEKKEMRKQMKAEAKAAKKKAKANK